MHKTPQKATASPDPHLGSREASLGGASFFFPGRKPLGKTCGNRKKKSTSRAQFSDKAMWVSIPISKTGIPRNWELLLYLFHRLGIGWIHNMTWGDACGEKENIIAETPYSRWVPWHQMFMHTRLCVHRPAALFNTKNLDSDLLKRRCYSAQDEHPHKSS